MSTNTTIPTETEGAAPSPAIGGEPENERLAKAAQDIAKIIVDGELNTKIEVGRLILDRFYGGDPARTSVRGAGDPTFRRLAELLKGSDTIAQGQSASTLWRCTKIASMVQTQPDLKELGLCDGQMVELSRINNKEALIRLARQVSEEELTVKATKAAVDDLLERPKRRPRGNKSQGDGDRKSPETPSAPTNTNDTMSPAGRDSRLAAAKRSDTSDSESLGSPAEIGAALKRLGIADAATVIEDWLTGQLERMDSGLLDHREIESLRSAATTLKSLAARAESAANANYRLVPA